MQEIGNILWIVVPLAALVCFGFCALGMLRAGRSGRWRGCCRRGNDGQGGVTGR